MTELITAATSVVVTLLAVWSTIIYPRSKEKKKAEAEAEKKEAERDQELDGIPAVPGITEGVPRLVLRVLALERSNNEVVAGQKLLERRMDEANGTGKRTEKMVEQILADRVSVAAAHVGLLDADAAGKLPEH